MRIIDALISARENLLSLHIVGREAPVFTGAMNALDACITALRNAEQEGSRENQNEPGKGIPG